MRSWVPRRLPILIAGLIAAGAGDPLVEAIAGSGAFGPGYADHNHLGVVPDLLAAGSVLGALFLLRCQELWQQARRFSAYAAAAQRLPRLADLPLAFAIQLTTVFGMELAEAALAGEPLQPGAGWLGGPLAWSLTIHAGVAVLAVIAMRRLLGAMPSVCAAVVRIALQISSRSVGARGGRGALAIACDVARAYVQTRLARRVGGRAPPFSVRFS